jgi:hypothetical protein
VGFPRIYGSHDYAVPSVNLALFMVNSFNSEFLPGYLVFIVLSFLSATKIEELIDQHGELNAMGINYRN